MEKIKKVENRCQQKTGDIFIWNLFINNEDFLKNNNSINNISEIFANYQKDEEILQLSRINVIYIIIIFNKSLS